MTSTLHRHQPGQHAAEQRRRHRRQVRAGDARSSGGFNVGRRERQPSARPRRGVAVHLHAYHPAQRGRAASVVVVNTAEVIGTDPAGTPSTDDRHRRRRRLRPGITLTKLVDGSRSVTVQARHPGHLHLRGRPTPATRRSAGQLVDDTPPCESPTRGADDPATATTSWTSARPGTTRAPRLPTDTSSTPPTSPATPLNPRRPTRPFPGPEPPVTATDTASVTVVDPGLTLTKVGRPGRVVFPGTEVTYTYTADEHRATTDLRNDTGAPGGSTDNRARRSTCSYDPERQHRRRQQRRSAQPGRDLAVHLHHRLSTPDR